MTDQTSLYYLALNGAAQGPFSGETVTSMYRSGTVPADTLTCPVGGTAWQPLHQFPSLIAPPPPPPPMVPPVAPFPPLPATVPPPAPSAIGYGAGPASIFGPPAPLSQMPPPAATGYGSPAVGSFGPPQPAVVPGGAPAPRFHVPRSHQPLPEVAVTHSPRDATKGVRISAIVAALICFFLPWLEFQCTGQRLISQTGVQAVMNTGTVDEEFLNQFKDMAAAKGQRLPGEATSTDKMMAEGPAWLTGIALVLSAFALIAAFGKSGKASSGMLSALAAGLLIWNAVTGFPMEDAIKKQMEGPASTSVKRSGPQRAEGRSVADQKMFKVVYTPWFYVTTGALAVAALLGLAGGTGSPRRS